MSWNAFLHVRFLRLSVHIFELYPQFPPRIFFLGSHGTGERAVALLVDKCPQGLAAPRSGGSSDSGLVTLSFLFPFRDVSRIYEIWPVHPQNISVNRGGWKNEFQFAKCGGEAGEKLAGLPHMHGTSPSEGLRASARGPWWPAQLAYLLSRTSQLEFLSWAVWKPNTHSLIWIMIGKICRAPRKRMCKCYVVFIYACVYVFVPKRR